MKFLRMVLSLGLLTICNTSFSQNIKQARGRINNKSFTYFYLEPAQEIKGLLILLPAWGESGQSIFKKTELPRLLADKNFLTIIPQLRQTLFADDYTIAQLNEIIRIACQRYKSNPLSVIVGGLSAGGAIAINYAAYCVKEKTNQQLKAVFAIDPPLDLVRLYHSAENKIKYMCKSKLIKKEGELTRNYLRRTFSGSPEENPEPYLKYAAYSAGLPDGGNSKFLKDVPIRLYSEPDLGFVRKTYCNELQYEDINAVDLDKLNKFLAGIGNNKAEYITTKGKGFHSWNILDPVDCTNWILKICSTYNN